jgi:multiple sugar transport system permease protein
VRKRIKEGYRMRLEKKSIFSVLVYVFVLAMAVIWIAPVVWSLLSSLKSEAEIATIGYKFFPIDWTLQNYKDIFTDTDNAPIFKWFINSIIISGSQTILVIIVASTSAYAYARLQFKGRNIIFWILMATVMFPNIINLIPMYKICDMLNWIDNPLSLIIPGVGGVYNIFLIRQFLISIPKDFDEAAFIDGAGEWTIFVKIILPLARPVLTVVALFTFTASWNDFLFPSVVINNVDRMPITPGLRLLQGVYEQKIAHTLAGAIVAIIPTFIVYLGAQKYFLQGLVLSSGVKG